MAYQEPNKDGFYGKFGGRFVPETLMTAVLELEKAYRESQADPSFQEELNQLLRQYVGRETPLYYAKNLTQHIGGAKIYLKREDLNHTGAHKINNALGQVLLAKRMGKKKIIAETGATSGKDMGKVMGVASKKLAGLAEGRAISAKVKELLG